jgi:hypothetical protein
MSLMYRYHFDIVSHTPLPELWISRLTTTQPFKSCIHLVSSANLLIILNRQTLYALGLNISIARVLVPTNIPRVTNLVACATNGKYVDLQASLRGWRRGRLQRGLRQYADESTEDRLLVVVLVTEV